MALIAGSVCGIEVGENEGVVLAIAPPVGINQADQGSIFKKIFGRADSKKDKAWWKTMEAKEERKAYTVAKPVKLSDEGVAVEKEKTEQESSKKIDSADGEIVAKVGSKEVKPVASAMPKVFVALRAGAMDPQLSKWETFYEDSRMKNIGLELGYHLKWGVSLLARAQAMEAKGKGLLSSTNALGADVDYRLYPLQGGLQWEFAFTPRDMVRPFVAGGYAHAIYRQKVSDGRRFKGKVSGSWAKGGILLDLSRLDENGIRRGQELFDRVDLILEVERLWLKSDAVTEDLGGLNLGVGFRVGF